MNLKKYLEIIKKNRCPNDCDLKKKKEIEIVLVLPPKEILGIIISRDPTIDWLYTYLKNETDENTRRKILFASAIPFSLLTKLMIFMRKMQISKDDKKCLFNVIFDKVYWTHLHKCSTDVNGANSEKFKNENAMMCANKWLKEELIACKKNKIKFILALGNDVKNWIKKWKDIKIIYLPHPSGQNNPIWYRSQKIDKKKIEKTERELEKLIKICKKV